MNGSYGAMCQVEEERRKVRGSFLSLRIDQTIMRERKKIQWEPKGKKKEKIKRKKREKKEKSRKKM